MARGIALSTAGVAVKYAVETEKGKRPTTGYTRIHDIKSTPSFNVAPETIESTDLEQEEYKTYVAGLKDLGGALEFGANFTQELQTHWGQIVEAYKSALAEGKRMWFEISHPKLEQAAFFPGEPAAMGLPETTVGGILETTLYITPNDAPVWEAKSTSAT